MRQDHQPQAGAVKRPERSSEEMRAVCGDTVAVILATATDTTPVVVRFDDPDTQPLTCQPMPGRESSARPIQMYGDDPLVAHAVKAAYQAQVAMVYVITDPSIASDVTHAAHSMRRRKIDPFVEVLAVEKWALDDRTREFNDYEAFGVPYSLLEICRSLAADGMGGYGSVLVMPADLPRIEADHIYELCADFNASPKLDAVTSWISWLRRPPFVFSTAFLNGLEDAATTAFGESGNRPAQCLNVIDHVFGEEQLAASPKPDARADAFFKGCTMTALQAVQLAKYARANPGKKLVSPNAPLSLTGPAEDKPLSVSDRLLVNIACKVLETGDAIAQGMDGELEWADAFGKRNKLDFPLLCDKQHAGKLAYLDSAATSQRTHAALQAQADFDAHANANVYRGAYDLSAQATFAYNDARKRLEDHIGAMWRETAFCANATAAINLVAQAWGEHNIEEDDLIVLSLAAHHSNLLPFTMLAERKGAQVEYVPYGPDGRLDRQAYRGLMAQGPKLVCIEHMGNVFGIVNPAAELADEAHDAGARFLLDATQSFSHRGIDVRELKADWVAFSAHKAYGPMGIGALWVSPEAFEEMDPLGAGGGSISHAGKSTYYLRPKSIQYELGTPPVSQAIGWAAAIDYMDTLGMRDIARHDAALTRYLWENLNAAEGVNVVGDHSLPDGQAGLVSFTLRGQAPAQVAGFLGKLDVAIRAGGHCALPLHAALGLVGSARISLGVHTTRDDIDAALVALEACRRVHEEGIR